MLLKLLIVFTTVLCCEAAIYSSFWAPLFDRRILNYQINVPFEPEAGRSARIQFEKDYGYRGERLIADLGNGKGPGDKQQNSANQIYGDVTFYYT